MKYTINGMSQQKLIDLGMDLIDAQILSWFSAFAFSNKMKSKTVNGSVYFWVNYDYVIEELPIAGIKDKGSLARRFKKMADAGILSHTCVKDSEGTFSYYGGGPEWASLTSNTPPSASKDGPPLLFEADPVHLKSSTKDSLIIDSPISDTLPSPQKGKAKDPEKAQEIRDITDFYQECFQFEYKGTESEGAKPIWDGKIIKLVKADIARLGADLLAVVIDDFFKNKTSWVIEKGAGLGYNVFHTQIDAILDRLAAGKRNDRLA